MTDLQMVEHLLKKTGRLYDKVDLVDKTIIQVYVFEGRLEFEFNINGDLEEDWDNSSVTTWLSGGFYYD